jgi:hypothetical protein
MSHTTQCEYANYILYIVYCILHLHVLYMCMHLCICVCICIYAYMHMVNIFGSMNYDDNKLRLYVMSLVLYIIYQPPSKPTSNMEAYYLHLVTFRFF